MIPAPSVQDEQRNDTIGKRGTFRNHDIAAMRNNGIT